MSYGYGFKIKMRRLIMQARLDHGQKSRLFWLMANHGPYATWHEYKEMINAKASQSKQAGMDTGPGRTAGR